METTEVIINEKVYRRMDEHLLVEGMFCNSDIYYIYKERPVLLCSKTVLNEGFFSKLREIYALACPIYVQKESYDSLKVQHELLSSNDVKNEKRISEVRDDFADMLKQSRTSEHISMDTVSEMAVSLQSTIDEIDLSFLLHWTSFMRNMDDYLQTHSTNVAMLNGKIASWIGMNEEEIKKAIAIGLLHDTGKVQIPSFILDKPAKLTKEEFEIIKRHPMYSYRILQNSGVTDQEVLDGVCQHHEKMNGSGYPNGLKMQQISRYAKITMISDIYDAMIAERVYKEARTPFEVLDEFYREQYAELDMEIVGIFLKRMETELVGKKVILSNGAIGKIKYIEHGKFLYPIVMVDGQVIQLSKEIQCVSLCTRTGVI